MRSLPMLCRGFPAALFFCACSLRAAAPPETWQEHWFEHDQAVTRAYYDDTVAIYFDDGMTEDVRSQALSWIPAYAAKLWKYTIVTYGSYGSEGRLYGLFHTGRYSGGHPSTYFDSGHDFRNVADVGPGPWGSPSYDVFTHEVGHIVEGASDNVKGSPAFGLWGDSKWCEIYMYDAYVGMGMNDEAERVKAQFSASSDSFPTADSHWFRDWYYPVWRDYGRSKVLTRFFQVLAANFPTEETYNGRETIRRYSRDINWGEYVYFMGAAARADLKGLASSAFGWSDEWESQYQAAQKEFSAIDPARDYPTFFGKKAKAKKKGGKRYRITMKIRDQNRIKRVTARAGRKLHVKARGENRYVVQSRRIPRFLKVVVVDGNGNRAKKRYTKRHFVIR